jgi:ferrous iron transport protein B
MYDELEARGDQLDHHTLGTLLGAPMVPTVCRTGRGVKELFEKVIAVYEGNDPKISRHIHINHGAELESSIDKIKAAFQRNDRIRYKYSTRYLAIKCLEGDKEVDSLIDKLPNHDEIISIRYAEQQRLQKELGESAESALIDAKYGFIQGALRETFRPAKRSEEPTLTDRIDRIVTHRIWGFPIFFALLFLMFEATFTLGQYPMDWLQWLVDHLGAFVADNMAPGALRDLLVDGIIGGVGAVIVFLPNILILYTFISLLEDSGYMARAAFIMDRLMHHMGLHGKSFIPMIMGFGCNVPAVIATRTIENPKSRLITMLVIPMMSCSARIPIYILLIGTFFPHHAAFVLLGLYALGILMAVLMAKLFSKVLLKGVDLPFVMELPPYRLPAAKSIGRHTWEKGRQYLRKMGHIILVASIIIWFLGYFPRPAEAPAPAPQPTASTQQATQPSTEVAAPQMSYLEQAGRLISPIMSPLGFDWRMNVGILSGVSAKELVVSTMGVMYAGEKIDDANAAGHDTHLQRAIARSLSPASALAYLVFILLYFPCIATVTAIKNETGRWKWAMFTIFYTTGLAYAVSFIVYRLALLFL